MSKFKFSFFESLRTWGLVFRILMDLLIFGAHVVWVILVLIAVVVWYGGTYPIRLLFKKRKPAQA